MMGKKKGERYDRYVRFRVKSFRRPYTSIQPCFAMVSLHFIMNGIL